MQVGKSSVAEQHLGAPLKFPDGSPPVCPGCPSTCNPPMLASKTQVLSLWAVTFFGSCIRFPAYHMFTLLFMAVAKLPLQSSSDVILGGLRGHHNMKDCIKGS